MSKNKKTKKNFEKKLQQYSSNTHFCCCCCCCCCCCERDKKNIYLSFVFIVVAVVVTFVSPQSLSFSLLDAEKRALCLLFEGGGGHHHDDQNSRRSEAERDFECFVWFSLSTSIQNSGAKTYTYSFVLEKGPLDTHHGASFLGPRTADAI